MMEYVVGWYFIGVFLHFVIGLGVWSTNSHYENEHDAKIGAKVAWLSPVWPLLWLYWVGNGLYKAFRYAWID